MGVVAPTPIVCVAVNFAGAPTSGTWSKGAIIIDTNANLWVCTVGGSPGTWSELATATGAVLSVTAADTSIVVGGTAQNPTVRTNTLDVIAADHPPAADWSNNSHKITSLANGSGAQDAAAFGQIPVPANGYGITGNTGATPTPAVALTSAGGVALSPVTLTNSATTKILDTSSLGVGTWLVTFIVLCTAAPAAIEIEMLADTATASFNGVAAGECPAGATGAVTVVVQAIVTVTGAGTIKVQAYNNNATGTQQALAATTGTAGYEFGTGYTAVRIA